MYVTEPRVTQGNTTPYVTEHFNVCYRKQDNHSLYITEHRASTHSVHRSWCFSEHFTQWVQQKLHVTPHPSKYCNTDLPNRVMEGSAGCRRFSLYPPELRKATVMAAGELNFVCPVFPKHQAYPFAADVSWSWNCVFPNPVIPFSQWVQWSAFSSVCCAFNIFSCCGGKWDLTRLPQRLPLHQHSSLLPPISTLSSYLPT